MHNLQKQLECTTNEVGAAHRNAAEEKDPKDVINERQTRNKKKASKRGSNAAQRHYQQNRLQKEEEERGIQRLKGVRNVENIRSSLVAQIDKKDSSVRKRKRKKNHTDITITSNIVDDSDYSDVFQSDIENAIQNVTHSEYTASSTESSPQKPKHKRIQQQISSPEYSTSVEVHDSGKNRNPRQTQPKPQNTQRIRNFSPPTQSPPREINSPTKPPWMRKQQEPKSPPPRQQKRLPEKQEKQASKRPERRISIEDSPDRLAKSREKYSPVRRRGNPVTIEDSPDYANSREQHSPVSHKRDNFIPEKSKQHSERRNLKEDYTNSREKSTKQQPEKRNQMEDYAKSKEKHSPERHKREIAEKTTKQYSPNYSNRRENQSPPDYTNSSEKHSHVRNIREVSEKTAKDYSPDYTNPREKHSPVRNKGEFQEKTRKQNPEKRNPIDTEDSPDYAKSREKYSPAKQKLGNVIPEKNYSKKFDRHKPEQKSPQKFYSIPSYDETEPEVQIETYNPKRKTAIEKPAPKQDKFMRKLTTIQDVSSQISNKSDESGRCRCEDSVLDSPQVGSDATNIKKLIAEHRPVDAYGLSTKISDRIKQRLSEQMICPEHDRYEHQHKHVDHLDEDHYHHEHELESFHYDHDLHKKDYHPYYQNGRALEENKNSYQSTKGIQTTERYNTKPAAENIRTASQEVQTTDRLFSKPMVQNRRTSQTFFQEPQTTERLNTKSTVENRRVPQIVYQEATDRLKNKTSPQKKNIYQLSPQEIQTTDRFRAKVPPKPKLQMESIQVCDIQSKNPQIDTTEASNLPYVPTTSVKAGTQKTAKTDKSRVETQPSMARYFDRLNHFTKDYRPQPIVEKMTKDSIEVHPPSARSERTDHLAVMREQDKRAHERGVKALEKEKIQQDYRQLMEDLPVLQRQERLAAMKNHDPMYHMSDERLQDLERRRQNRIEQIFEKYYNKAKTLEAPLITIRPVQKTPPSDDMRLPFKALDVTDVQLNVAEWKVGDNTQDKILLTNKDGSEAVQTKEIYKRIPNSINKNSEFSTETKAGRKGDNSSKQKHIEEKQKSLTEMLQRVNKQRELLLQEVATLPASSNLQKILADEEILKIAAEDKNLLTNKSSEGKKTLSSKSSSEEQKSLSSKSSSKSSSDVHKKYVSTATSPVAVITSSKNEKGSEGKKRGKGTSSSDSSEESLTKKKPKKKSKKEKILIKNMETQTSPPIHSEEVSPKNHRRTSFNDNVSQSSKSHNESTNDKICEIIIKMTDDAEIQINTEGVSSSKEISAAASSDPSKSSVKYTQRASIASARERRKIANSYGNDVSSSTTYLSPPEILVPPLKECSAYSDQQKMYKEILHKKPQQTNRINRKEITPNLLNYIKKLLSMSRRSIDELTVSSVSDITSPGPSIIETADNNPLIQLQNVMNYYNLNFADIQQHFTISDSSTASLDNQQSPVLQIAIEPQPGPSKSSHSTSKPTSGENPSNQRSTSEEIQPSQRPTSESTLDQPDALDLPYVEILNKYQELTKNCCEKITALSAMIDKVRLEKQRLMSPVLSERNEISTTSYMELPKERKSNDKKSSDEMAEQQNDSPKDDKQMKEKSTTSTDSYASSVNNNVVENYLLTVSPTAAVSISSELMEQPDFVPMLQGIPKYNLQSEQKSQPIHLLDSPVKQFLVNSKSRPPPALNSNMQRYNLNIDMTPHELSTIVEMDTVASSKNASEMLISKHQSQQLIPAVEPPQDYDDVNILEEDLSSSSEFRTITPERFMVMESQKELHKISLISSMDSNKSRRKSALRKSPKHKATDRATASQISGVQPLGSDRASSSTSPEDMEKILRNMGLGWAVSTLKKTHEALALSSTSTSSVETSFKKRVSFKEYSSTNSEVSLKDVITKEFFKKLTSSSSSSSDISPRLQENNPNISEIIGGAPGTQSRDRSQHRTSTPVQQSRSTDSKNNNLFSGESDVSSVRHSQENLFLSIPNISLDTNRTLDKSNK